MFQKALTGKTSLFRKIYAILFVLSGLIMGVVAIFFLNIDTGNDTIYGAIAQVLGVTKLLNGLLNMLVGWYLWEKKRWAYYGGIALMFIPLFLSILAIPNADSIRWGLLIGNTVMLLLLFTIRTEFKLSK